MDWVPKHEKKITKIRAAADKKRVRIVRRAKRREMKSDVIQPGADWIVEAVWRHRREDGVLEWPGVLLLGRVHLHDGVTHVHIKT